MSEWRWPNFKPSELACRHCGCEGTKDTAKDALQSLRERYGGPLIINSAYRCPEHNAAVGGAMKSHHVKGDAFDISTVGWSRVEKLRLEEIARKVGFTGFGYYDSFIHIDMGRPRTWGNE